MLFEVPNRTNLQFKDIQRLRNLIFTCLEEDPDECLDYCELQKEFNIKKNFIGKLASTVMNDIKLFRCSKKTKTKFAKYAKKIDNIFCNFSGIHNKNINGNQYRIINYGCCFSFKAFCEEFNKNSEIIMTLEEARKILGDEYRLTALYSRLNYNPMVEEFSISQAGEHELEVIKELEKYHKSREKLNSETLVNCFIKDHFTFMNFDYLAYRLECRWKYNREKVYKKRWPNKMPSLLNTNTQKRLDFQLQKTLNYNNQKLSLSNLEEIQEPEIGNLYSDIIFTNPTTIILSNLHENTHMECQDLGYTDEYHHINVPSLSDLFSLNQEKNIQQHESTTKENGRQL